VAAARRVPPANSQHICVRAGRSAQVSGAGKPYVAATPEA
jgi:hypothetical protein